MTKLARFAIVGVIACALALGATAAAKDSHAPSAAGDRWLPCEPWVMYHWLPFDSKKLYADIGVDRSEWHKYIHADDDKRSLSKFIRLQRKDPKKVVARLMKRWDGRVSAEQRAELDRRANELLTQGHLAQHVFFHLFHHPMIGIRAKYIFHLSTETYYAARMDGFTPREIAKHGGVSVRGAVDRALKVLRASQDEGVKTNQTSRAQARVFLAEERRWVKTWLRQSLRNKEFPHPHTPMTGTREQRACTLMTGPNHIPGEHENVGT